MKTWVKLHTSFATDPGIGRMSWAQKGLLASLLALAGLIDDRDGDDGETGILESVADTAWRLRCDEQEIRELMAAWDGGTRLIERDGVLVLVRYGALQARKPSDSHEAVAERVKRSREAKRACNADVTPVNRDESRLESESESDTESEKKQPEHTQTRGAAAPAGVVAAAAVDEADSGEDGEGQAELLQALQEAFSRATGVRPPETVRSGRAREELRDKWLDPLARIARDAAWDADLGARLVDKAVQQLQARNMMITCPRSIADVAGRLAGKERARGDMRRRDMELLSRSRANMAELQGQTVTA